ncbi:hypothetical protein HPB51_029844 [Rhipicephalus microplus]|uniref:Uncharacterized protein n=1 Tax=Rhipicephalus microplus TaxID=6941 RepID=A0A9J6CSK5_RHIMP|nr:hypothetical protein HPB51_029844 [Rhipicephalus microplus]
MVPRTTRTNSDSAKSQTRTAVGDSGVCAALPMHDAPVAQHLEAPTLDQAEEADAEVLDGHRMVSVKATDGDHHRWQVRTIWEQGKQTVRDSPLLKQTSSKSLVLMHRRQKLSMAQFFSRAGYGLTLGHRRNILASLHQQHTRSSAPIDRCGRDSSSWSLPRSEVLWSTGTNRDDAGPNVRTAVGDSGVCAAFPMHDAPVVQRLEAQTLNYTRKTALSKAQFFCRAGYHLTLGHRRNILASLHQQHTRSSAPIDRGGLDSSLRSLPRSLVLRSTRPNSDDDEPHVRAADGDSGVCTASQMHDAPVVQRLEASTLNHTRKTALGHALLCASPSLQALHVAAAPVTVTRDLSETRKEAMV